MILINAGTPIQPDGLCNEPGVNEVLLTYLAGMEGGLAAADILCGDVNPSGQPDIDISDTGCFGGLERLQWPRIPCSDGPAGLRTKPQCEIKTTARPCEALLASTWDCALIEKIGEAGAGEFRENNIGIWMAPGMNIHRSACCGRNFEYYSEDPLLSGRLAGAMTKGVQAQGGVGTTIKHFACNNQEDNRMASDSVISERALREIYLKGFAYAVTEQQPLAIMTSYNLINGVHAANSYDLCTKIARDEWGFKGVIMTDWTTTQWGDDCTASGCMRAGNDLVMPGVPQDHENIRQALADGSLTVQELKRAVAHLLPVVFQSDRYED